MKKIISFVLMLVCAFSFSVSLSFFANGKTNGVSAEENQDAIETEHTVTSNVSEIFDLDQKVPEGYEKDSPSPEGKSLNDEFISIVESELVLTTSSKGNQTASVKVIDKMTLTDQKPASNDFSLESAYGMSYVDSVAFNAIGNEGANRDSYAVYLGISGKNLKVYVIDLVNQVVVSNFNLGKASWISGSNVPQFNFKHFIDVTAGDYDGDGVDEIAVTALTDTQNSVYLFDDYTLSSYKEFDVKDLVDTSKVDISDFVKVDNSKTLRPIISLASGDFDADDVEELAISISTSKHTVKANVSKETITTNVAVVDLPFSNTCILKRSVVGKTDVNSTTPNKHRLLYSSQIASGDVNSDGIDEIVVAGYVGEVEKRSNSLANKYSISENKIGLAVVQIENGKLTNGEISVHSMNAFMQSGFYSSDDVWTPLAVETANVNGPQTADLVFVSGTIYDLKSESPLEKYVFEMFKTDREKGSNTYVEKVVAGNFNNDTIGREGFAFSICYKYKGQHKYSYQLGYINGTFKDNEDKAEFGGNLKFCDNSKAIYGKYWINEKGGYVNTTNNQYGTNFVITAADCDDDGVQVKYLGTSYAYADPEVKAVLQAAPYFKELGEAGDFSNETSYTITTSYGSSYGVERTIGGQAGGYISSEIGGFFASVKFKIGVSLGGAYSWGFEREHSKTYTDSFTATEKDTVIICRIPVKQFHYQVTNTQENGEEFFFANVDLKPVFYQLSIEDFNAFVDVYNEKLQSYNKKCSEKAELANVNVKKATNFLKKIDENVLPANTAGNPQNYYDTLPVGGEIISKNMHAFGHNAGSNSVSYEDSHSHTKTSTHNFHASIEVEMEGKVGAWVAKASVGGVIGIDYSRDRTSSKTTSSAVEFAGEVGNANSDNEAYANPEMVKMYNFNWQFARWQRELYTDGTKVPVIGYIVNNVTKAGPTPEAVLADFNNQTNNVDIDWQKSTETTEDVLEGFIIYRQVTGGNMQAIAEVGADVTSYSEPYSNLTARSIYTYYVSAKYRKYGSSSEYYECRSFTTATIVGGVNVANDQIWTGISTLEEINGSGHYYLLNDVTINEPISVTNDIVLDLNGHWIDVLISETPITVQNGANFELCDFAGEGIIYAVLDSGTEKIDTVIKNYGNLTIAGGYIISVYNVIKNYGTLTINEGLFDISEGYVIENIENGVLYVNGGKFEGWGSSNVFGIYHNGEDFYLNGGCFNYFASGIDVAYGKYLTLEKPFIVDQSIPVRVLNELGQSVTGEFTNVIGSKGNVFYDTFISIDYQSDVCLSVNERIIVCYHNYVESNNRVNPTCENDGYVIHVCEICKSYQTEILEAHGHDYGEWVSEVPATTENYGVVAHYKCSRCKEYFDENYNSLYAIYIGKTGEQGEQGEKGEQGEQGEKGDKGDPGEKGSSGCSSNLISNEYIVTLIGLLVIVCSFSAYIILKRKRE